MGRWQSLRPGGGDPSSLETLVATVPPGARPTVRGVLESVSSAIDLHFPENIFADLDRLAATLGLTVVEHGAASAREQGERLVTVHALFGRHTAIHFRYVHDFLYGFDWARWVAREPETRRDVGPFDLAFLEYSEARAQEMLELIARNDPKYGLIDTGEHRNPFTFRRDPDAESALLRGLAADEAIPVAAWRSDVPARWDRPYTAIREAKARELGLEHRFT